MVDGTCHYAADNREFDQGEPERVVVVDDSYLDRHAPIARERIAMSGSLHTLWGSCIVAERLGMHPLAIAPELRAGITDEQCAEWLASDPVDWANESFAIARKPEVGYCVRVGETCQYAADNREFDEGEPERVVVVDGGYLDMNAPIARGRIARQGFGWPACLIERWVIERCLNLASPVKQFTGPDAPRCQIRLSQRVSMASKGVPGDVPEQRDCEGYASGAPLPLTRAIGRTARARGANPVTKYHRELRSIRPSANGDTGRASPTTF